MSLGYVLTILGAEHVLKENLEAIGQLLNVQPCHAEVLVGLGADG